MMKTEPIVSIIIPVYNGSNFLSQAIECALGQTYKNTEILVINDGSTDNGESEKIALSYGDRIRYYHKENGGVSSALNYAFKKMNGEYFSWLSHDDLYYPEKTEIQISFLNQLAEENPDIDLKKAVLHTATESIDCDGKVIKTPNYSDLPIRENTIDTIIGNVFNYRLSGCSFLLPKACIADVGEFREDIRTVSDVEYWYRLLFGGYQFYCIHRILVKNRSHGKQVGKTKVSLFDRELDELHRDIADRLNAYPGTDTKDMERFYLGLKKRGITGAAEYTFQKYLKGEVTSPMSLHFKAIWYTALGKGRTIARDVFRKIKVK